ncbi:hypothetical protein TrST_g6882 [Triparma strigata]|uniref:Uncharacterized protein n=1 Tax=Triparma strigata TaxID=1606541 RepID=A0A9W7BCS5_9STRA|nr:hypothetical protein TrST_g6882 [Triparma strigata]
MEREYVLSLGGYEDVEAEDYKLWIKILMEGGKIGNYTGIGVKYRKWGGGISEIRRESIREESLNIAREYCSHLVGSCDGLEVLRGGEGDMEEAAKLLDVIEGKFEGCEEIIYDVEERRRELAWKGCRHAWEVWREKAGGGGEVGRCWIETSKNWK